MFFNEREVRMYVCSTYIEVESLHEEDESPRLFVNFGRRVGSLSLHLFAFIGHKAQRG